MVWQSFSFPFKRARVEQSSTHTSWVIINFNLRRRLKLAKSNGSVSAAELTRHTLTPTINFGRDRIWPIPNCSSLYFKLTIFLFFKNCFFLVYLWQRFTMALRALKLSRKSKGKMCDHTVVIHLNQPIRISFFLGVDSRQGALGRPWISLVVFVTVIVWLSSCCFRFIMALENNHCIQKSKCNASQISGR